MIKKNVIILASFVLSVLVIILLGYSIYYFSQPKNNNGQNIPGGPTNGDASKSKKQQVEEMQAAYNAQFPDLITGVVNIISDNKTTIKLKSGVEYLISPARPKQFFNDSGIKNGDNVEARGKIMDNGLFSLGSIVIKK